MTEDDILLLLQQLGLAGLVLSSSQVQLARYFRLSLQTCAATLQTVAGGTRLSEQDARNAVAQAAGFPSLPAFDMALERFETMCSPNRDTASTLALFACAWPLLMNSLMLGAYRGAELAFRQFSVRLAIAAGVDHARAWAVIERLSLSRTSDNAYLLRNGAANARSWAEVTCFQFHMLMEPPLLEPLIALARTNPSRLRPELARVVEMFCSRLVGALSERNSRYVDEEGDLLENGVTFGHIHELGSEPQDIEHGSLDALLHGFEEPFAFVKWARECLAFESRYGITWPLSVTICLSGEAPHWVPEVGRLNSVFALPRKER